MKKVLSLLLLFGFYKEIYGSSNWINTSDIDFNGGTSNGISVRGTGNSSYIELANDWTEKTSGASPSNRAYYYMSYDSAAERVILFGGLGASALQDTWEYNFSSNTWTNRNASNPPSARYKGVMVYNSTQQVMVLFGGYNGGVKGETWVYSYSSNGWTQKFPAASPSARFSHGMAYDALNDKVILFGGTPDGSTWNGETWVYDVFGNTWTQKTPPSYPSSRAFHSMCYMGNGKVLLFGGFDGIYKSDTWVYELANGVQGTWTQKTPITTPSERGYHSLAYDSSNTKIVLFGGFSGGVTYYNETWCYDITNDNWKNMVPPVLPSARYKSTIGFDNINQKIIMFGGENNVGDKLADTWAYSLRLNNSNTNTWVSPAKDTGVSTTTLSWMNISWTPTSQPSGTELKFQIATNNDNTTWSFLGPDGTTGTSYLTAAGQSINSVHNGNRYIKVKTYLNSTNLSTPSLQDVTVTYNRSPTPPSLLSPSDTSVTTTTPAFTWNNSSDDDGDTKTYTLYLDTVATFNSVNLRTYAGISEGTGTTSFTVSSALSYGIWYWKVVSYDGSAYSSNSAVRTIDADTSPSVTISSPNSGDWSGSSQSVVWTYSDPDGVGYQISSFTVKLSQDSGGTYPITIGSGIAPTGSPQTLSGVNTKQYANSGFCKIKVIAVDGKGLTGEGISSGVFTINNPNEPPVVTLTSFNSGSFSGVQNITWTVSDPNGADTHTFDIKLSSDGGSDGYPVTVASGLSSSPYSWSTGNHPNGTQYKIKVIATDNGTPVLQGNASSSSNFVLNNSNQAPNTFSLLLPAHGSTLSDDTPNLSWQNNGDPDSGFGDSIASYKLHYSTNNSFSPDTVISGIATNSYTMPKLNDLTTYYWKVEALDTQSVSRFSTETFSFRIDRKNVFSANNIVTININSELPDNSYLKVNTISSDMADRADSYAAGDPLIKPINSISRYVVDVYDTNDSKIQDVNISATISFSYMDADNNGVLDGTSVPIKYLRVFKLNEITNKWEIISNGYSLDTTSNGYDRGKGEPSGISNEVIWDGRNGAGSVVANGMYNCEIIAKPPDGSESMKEIRRIGVIK